MTEHNLGSLLAAERGLGSTCDCHIHGTVHYPPPCEFCSTPLGEPGRPPGRHCPGVELSGKSAATGRPHYFGRLYEADAPCTWCGETRGHEWHIDREPELVMEVRPEAVVLGLGILCATTALIPLLINRWL